MRFSLCQGVLSNTLLFVTSFIISNQISYSVIHNEFHDSESVSWNSLPRQVMLLRVMSRHCGWKELSDHLNLYTSWNLAGIWYESMKSGQRLIELLNFPHRPFITFDILELPPNCHSNYVPETSVAQEALCSQKFTPSAGSAASSANFLSIESPFYCAHFWEGNDCQTPLQHRVPKRSWGVPESFLFCRIASICRH